MMGGVSRPLIDRLLSKIYVPGDDEDTAGTTAAEACWPWTGAVSQSGRRGVFYGEIREGGRSRKVWRVNRLVLLLQGLDGVPMRDGESLIEWLHRADAYVKERGWEASHRCDVSLCARWDHLEWRSHGENVADGAERRRRRDG